MEKIELNKVCVIRNGYAFKSSEFVDKGLPIVRIGEIKNGEVDLSSPKHILPKDKFEPYKIRRDDILIAMSGATTGKIGKYNLDIPAYQNQRVGCFLPDKSKLYNDYLYQYLSFISPTIIQNAYGGAQPNISSKELGKTLIPLPSLENQKRIAKVLSDCESLIQKRKESIELLDEFLKSTFLEMFGDHFTNKEGLPIVNLEDVAKNEKNAIVDGPFGSSLKNADYFEDGIPIIRINNIRDEGFYGQEFKYILESKYQELIRSKVDFGDILIARVGNTIGKSCVFDKEYKALLSTTGVAKASIDPEKAELNFIAQQLRLPHYRDYIWNQVAGGGQPYLNLKKIKSFKLVLPELKEQKKYSVIVEQINKLKSLANSSLLELENLYGSLSQKAFKGELDLSKVIIPKYVDISGSAEGKSNVSGDLKAKITFTGEKVIPKLSENDKEKILKSIIRYEFRNKEFTVSDIEKVLKEKRFDFSSEFIKSYIKNVLLNHYIKQTFSGTTQQIMFKLLK